LIEQYYSKTKFIGFELDRECEGITNNIKEYFFIPNKPEEIDHTPIVLKLKAAIQSPLKNGHKTETN
jgi:Ni,Fe-hydrogenase I cytochrome b subunit